MLFSEQILLPGCIRFVFFCNVDGVDVVELVLVAHLG